MSQESIVGRAFRAVVAAVVAVGVTVVSGGPVSAAPRDGAAAKATALGPVRQVHTVTLVTGDVVRLSTLADGRQTATVAEGKGFRISERGGDLYAVPDEALPHVRAGRLDEALFNLTDLVADGYDDGARTTLPLIVAGERAEPLAARGGATRRRVLPSIDGVAVAANKSRVDDLWDSIVDGPSTFSSGVRKVWLDRKMRATLSDSVPQIGAPAAWRAGYDGAGVKVAVLDTGYDPTHPALRGRVAAAANLTEEPDAVDGFGHGTHVASIVAGRATNAGAGGDSGVAPGARLLVAKVLDSAGIGEMSWVIAGMEWAVSQGARVVNLSLGTTAELGPDPATDAIDALTASSGALFVVSAGNSGPGLRTVNSPGTADAALTVGAVDDHDALAGFSSRGPRLGDAAPKPEITAPGVGIVAARAAGTSLGEVVDARSVAVSGTSMAAPHVAGAAALVAQRHPDWSATQIKAALVSSARPNGDTAAWAQGAGRVDVAAALDSPVLADPPTVNLGRVAAGAADPSATVTYRNTGTTAVTLSLSAEAAATGAEARAARLAVTPSRLTVPAGGVARATVRLDTAATTPGQYAGVLTALAGDRRLRTPLGFNLSAPLGKLTVAVSNHDGGSPPGAHSTVLLWNLDDEERYYAYFPNGSRTTTLELPRGRYALFGIVYREDEAGYEREATLLTDPQLEVTADRSVEFDGRTASQLRVDTHRPTSAASLGIAWQRVTATQSLLEGYAFNTEVLKKVYAVSSQPPSLGTFRFLTRLDLAAPPITGRIGGADGQALETIRPLEGAPPLDGRQEFSLVDGGNGTPAELAAARGKAVLVRFVDDQSVETQMVAASAAGARAILLVSDQPGYQMAIGVGSTVPAYGLEQADGQRLRTALASGPVSLTLTGVPESPYRYDITSVETGRIPADLTRTEDELQLATVDSVFHGHTDRLRARDGRAGYVEGVDVGLAFDRAVTRPGVRTDYVSTGNVSWRHQVDQETVPPLDVRGAMYDVGRTFRPGERAREAWFTALTRPAVPDTTPDYSYGTPVNRWHDAIRVAVPQYANGSAGQYGWLDYRSDAGRLTLRRGDRMIDTTTLPYTQFTVPAGDARYRLTLDVTRDRFEEGEVWWTTSTATSTTWTFRSGRPRGDRVSVLPLLQVGYQIDTDITNTVRARGSYPLRLDLGYQPGHRRSGRIAVDVRVSYDDGAHWRPVPTTGARTVTATVPPAPAGARFATIKVTATDTAGNRIDQTITRAWKVDATQR
jgi:subtilisin family serine protease